ncbi:MAG TPA: LysM peptidoglycan-binding domain-containing protein [Kiritimatiellia bacterium]|nr:LysM peptidoglycan-binding domain-containing protein [Kiritimatiellia bacterium]HRZ13776.1 LysM peptidoglycan-binding domain-containing protein [Kiritimatiellia bacterium]HSA19715.1 LysM peptidoglycan-binding domain-containing protein [Kiritimatiellia bacterium]
MKSSVLIAAVVGIHVLAVGGVAIMQGCETRRVVTEQPPPPAPPMPPKAETLPAPVPKPVFQPPVPVEPAPSVMEPGAGRTYEIQNGDSLSKIAARFGVSTRELADLNKIKDPNNIRIGQKLVLPDYAKDQPASSSKPKAKAKVAVPEGAETYTVQAGDMLSKIAVKYGVKTADLRAANNLSGDKIIVGQKLVIPGAKAEKKEQPKDAAPKAEEAAPLAEPPPAPATEPVMAPPAPVTEPAASAAPQLQGEEPPMDYTVQPGDTVDSIAKMYIIRKEQILQLNNLTEGAELKPGQKIKLPTTM